MFAASKTDSASTGGYQIQRSLRFNRADSAYLSRTPASAGNRKAWTMSFWIKRSDIVNRQIILEQFSAASDTGYCSIEFASDAAAPTLVVGGYNTTWRVTTQVFRDVSAWYHIVVAVDTTLATANNRVRIYLNGSEITSFSTLNNPTQNADTGANSTGPAGIGSATSGGTYLNGYMTEIYMVDGQQLTPSSFGETNAQTGVWQPKAYSGSYGTNGFYLNFSDNSNTTAATLGKDYSGNGNNWTPNNFSVTAGAGNDSLVDSPTSYGTDTGVGGTVRGNYGTLNPLFNATTLTNGNLDASLTTASTTGTFGASSSKWYFECTVNSKTDLSATDYLGIANETLVKSDSSFSYSQVYVYLSNAQKGGNGGSGSYGASWTVGDVIGVAYDLDAGSITFYKNGTSQGVAYSTGFTAGSFWRPFLYSGSGTNTFTFNFGQRPFAYTAPSGYKALCTQNLPTPTIGATTATQAGKYYNAVTYAGTSATNSIANGINMASNGGLVWTKSRSQAGADPVIYDSIRGPGYFLKTDGTGSEIYSSISLVSFDSDGVTFGADTAQGYSNYAPYGNYVAWAWAAGGSGVTNTAGSITSTVSANTTSGFSVVTYTGNSTVGATVGHGLGVAPSMMFIKGRTNVDNWHVYSSALGNTGGMFLNNTNAFTVSTYFWNNTSPSSTVFTLSSGSSNNSSGVNYVAYCFAPVAGYSAFGSYTGNGSSDGPMVYFGFRPAFVMLKNTTTAGNDWQMIDVVRGTYNVEGPTLVANYSGAENTYTICDFLSNGVKFRDTNQAWNKSGDLYIYMAFASNPFKTSLAR